MSWLKSLGLLSGIYTASVLALFTVDSLRYSLREPEITYVPETDTIYIQPKVESVWRMWTQDTKQGYAFAELFNVNDTWFLSTNLPVNRDELFYVLKVCQDSSIDIPEMMQTVWRESRIGCNLQHKLNYDGSIDGGWFGLNSRYHPIKTLGNPKKDIYLYIAFLRKNLDPYPDNERYYRYVYGSKKAKELGYVK